MEGGKKISGVYSPQVAKLGLWQVEKKNSSDLNEKLIHPDAFDIGCNFRADCVLVSA